MNVRGLTPTLRKIAAWQGNRIRVARVQSGQRSLFVILRNIHHPNQPVLTMSDLPDTSKCIDQCNSLLRGEISAVEAYDKALEKFSGDVGTLDLNALRASHQESVADLQRNVQSMGGEVATDSGAWGVLTNSIQSVSNVFGNGSAVASLLQGEEHGKADYERALDNDDMLSDCKELVRNTLLPRIEQNIATLKAVQDANS